MADRGNRSSGVPQRRSSTRGRRPGEQRPARGGKGKRPKGLVPLIKYSAARLGGKLIRSPLVPIIGGLVLLLLLLAGSIWLFTNKNAYDVYVGGEVVASVAKDKDVTDKWIYDNALAKMATDLGSKVQVEQEVKLVPVHRSGKLSSVEYAIGAVYKALMVAGYKLEAADIYVNSVRIVTLRSEAEANDVLKQVIRSYAPVDATVVEEESEFVDDVVEVRTRFADSAEIESAERAMTKLTLTTDTEIPYQVRTGDSVWQISRLYGTSQERLKELNPDVPELQTGNIRAGQVIKVITPKPICSVKTVELITYTDTLPRTVEERPAANQPAGYRKVIQEGKDGTREVVAHLVRLNGVDTGERIEIESTPLVNAVLEIVEVGTGS